MMIHERMVARLKESIPSLGGRVFPAVKPGRIKQWPCALYVSVGGAPIEAMEGSMPRPAYRVDILAKGYNEGARLARDVVIALDRGPGKNPDHDPDAPAGEDNPRHIVLTSLLAEAPSHPLEMFDEEADVYRFSTTFVLAG